MLKIRDVNFIKSCSSAAQFPRRQFPEFAFIGRSNVGKSSLINMLMRKKDLVKTGSKPGVTRTINFFTLNGELSLADLPGFGYAKIPHTIRKTFMPLIRNYLLKRDELRLVFLLVDIRRVPDRYEQDLLALITGNRTAVAVVLTKCDKVSRGVRARNARIIGEALGVDHDALFLTSARTGDGRRDLMRLIEEYSIIGNG